jgi:hypothetical protein
LVVYRNTLGVKVGEKEEIGRHSMFS